MTIPSRNLNICMQSHIDLTLHGDVRKICTRSTRPPPRPSWPQYLVTNTDRRSAGGSEASSTSVVAYMTAFHTPSCHAQVMLLDHSFPVVHYLSPLLLLHPAAAGVCAVLMQPMVYVAVRARNQNASFSQLSAKRSACINHRPVRPPVRGHCALTNVHSVSVHSMSSLCPATN